MRRVLFFHVPKCAGTTVFEHLERHMGRTRLDRALGRRTSMLIHTKHHADQLSQMTATASKARLVYGHFDWNTYLRMTLTTDDFKFTFLREPIERLKSSYKYFCSDQGWEFLNLSGKPSDYSFEEYLTAGEPSDQWAVDNVAVRMFSGSLDNTAVNDKDWEELLHVAKRRLSELDYVGFQENLNSDFARLCKTIGISSLNIESKRITNTSRQIAENSSLSSEISKRTKWDEKLYRFAKSI